MALRRYRRVRRIPRRRRTGFRRRLYRRGRKFRARVAPGDMLCKLSKISSISVDNQTNHVYYTSVKLSDFDEWSNMRAVFQRTKIIKMKVTVMPLQNVANNSTSTVPAYCMIPWHQPPFGPTTNFNGMISIDKHKLRRQTQGCTQSYVPSILQMAKYQGSTGNDCVVVWRPTLSNDFAQETTIFGGAIGFQGDDSMEGRKTHFNIKIELYVKMVQQESIS
ncbi:putative capsid protein [Bat associated cyclovirus 2]|uniref:Putative capsid protein n=1 Tax=Bat associated cyclovirus 2 TaxID=2050585 RepID=G1D7G3_9CIRC|nr:putative capsid protein [Bat associated cyclovirus 2]AEL87787.1 putative capsid protein [Bat associated cyclovirus 2]